MDNVDKRKYEYFIAAIIITIVAISGVYYYNFIYVPNQWENPFQKVSVIGVEANKGLFITVHYMNDGGWNANVTNIFIDSKPIASYPTFVDIRDANGSSIKSLLNGSGYIIPKGKNGDFPKGKITLVFTADAFASGQVINIGFHTAADVYPNQVYFNATCKIP